MAEGVSCVRCAAYCPEARCVGARRPNKGLALRGCGPAGTVPNWAAYAPHSGYCQAALGEADVQAELTDTKRVYVATQVRDQWSREAVLVLRGARLDSRYGNAHIWVYFVHVFPREEIKHEPDRARVVVVHEGEPEVLPDDAQHLGHCLSFLLCPQQQQCK